MMRQAACAPPLPWRRLPFPHTPRAVLCERRKKRPEESEANPEFEWPGAGPGPGRTSRHCRPALPGQAGLGRPENKQEEMEGSGGAGGGGTVGICPCLVWEERRRGRSRVRASRSRPSVQAQVVQGWWDDARPCAGSGSLAVPERRSRQAGPQPTVMTACAVGCRRVSSNRAAEGRTRGRGRGAQRTGDGRSSPSVPKRAPAVWVLNCPSRMAACEDGALSGAASDRSFASASNLAEFLELGQVAADPAS